MTISATSGGSAAQPNLPGDKPAILQLGPLYQPAQQRVEQLFRVHKYWLADAAGRSAMLAGPARDCRAVLTNGFFGVDNAIMDALPTLQMVSYGTVGYDRIDVARAVARGIRITNTPGVLNDAVTELAIGMLISAARRIPQGDRFVRSGAWERGGFALAQQVSHKKLGILGLGRIGRAIAEVASMLKIQVSYHSRRPVADVPWPYHASVLAMAEEVDFLLAIVPGGEGTRHIINEAVMKALGPQGVLINVARGSVVDEAALARCLADGSLGAAALDVFEEEPKVHPALMTLDNVVLQPHVGSATHDTRLAMGNLAIDNLLAFFAGQNLLTPVPESLPG